MNKGDRQMILYVLGTIILMVVLFYYLAVQRGVSFPKWFSSDNGGQTEVSESNNLSEVTFTSEPENTIDQTHNYTADIVTNKGQFTVNLFEENAPNTVNNFVFLSDQNYYDGTSFHRLIPNVLIQGGSRNTLNEDPEDDKLGGPGYTITDEINWESSGISGIRMKELEKEGFIENLNLKSKDINQYRLAMASSGPDTAGSQFFIVLGTKDNTEVEKLNGRYTVFGEVTENQELIDSINDLELNLDNPSEPRSVEKIVIEDIIIHKPEE